MLELACTLSMESALLGGQEGKRRRATRPNEDGIIVPLGELTRGAEADAEMGGWPRDRRHQRQTTIILGDPIHPHPKGLLQHSRLWRRKAVGRTERTWAEAARERAQRAAATTNDLVRTSALRLLHVSIAATPQPPPRQAVLSPKPSPAGGMPALPSSSTDQLALCLLHLLL